MTLIRYFTILVSCACWLINSAAVAVGVGDVDLFPSTYDVVVGYGQTEERILSVRNTGRSSSLDWKLIIEGREAGPNDDLSLILDDLNESSADLLDIIPDRFPFSGGITGSSISDGGNDMYDYGNTLRLDGRILNYSSNSVRYGTHDVPYFTRKLNGLFVFAAQPSGLVDEFSIYGNLGANGVGSVSAEEFTFIRSGQQYRAYVKRVHGAGDPSINHLFLVPDHPNLKRIHSATTHNENHRLTGIADVDAFYYLLFARPNGGFYPTETFENLAKAFLSSISTAPSWIEPQIVEGTLGVRREARQDLRFTLDASGLAPGVYSTQVAAVPADMDPENVPEQAYATIRLVVEEPEYAMEYDSLSLTSTAGLNVEGMRVAVLPRAEGAIVNGLQASCDVPWLKPSVSENRLNVVDFDFETSGLAPGIHRAQVEIWNKSTRYLVPVILTVAPLNISQLLPDPQRRWIYAINKKTAGVGSVLVIDSVRRETVGDIPVGNDPTDMSLSRDNSELFVINHADRTISVIDLESFEVTETIELSAYSTWSGSSGVTHAHVIGGNGDVIYYVDGQWGPRLRVYNRATGTVLQTLGAESLGTSNDDGFGDVALSPGGTRLFGWKQYGWTAGVLGTYIVRYDVQSDGTLTNRVASPSARTTNFDRDPLDTPAIFTSDGSRFLVKDRVVDQDQPSFYPVVYPDEIYAVSPLGEIVAGETAIYDGAGRGTVLHDFQQGKTVQAITPDYAQHVSFNAVTGAIDWLDLIDLLGPEVFGLDVVPADGSVLMAPEELRWFPVAGVREYRVYLGTDEEMVNGATLSSPEFLGQTNNNFIAVPSGLISPGSTWFWRVEPLDLAGVPLPGTTRSFTASTLTFSQSEIEVRTLPGVKNHIQKFTLGPDTGVSWSASSETPWIEILTSSGTTESELIFNIDTTGLTAPSYFDGSIDVTAEGGVIEVPVTLRLDAINFTRAETDLGNEFIYAISEESLTSSLAPSYFLKINSVTEEIEQAIDIGRSASDLAIHYRENRIYVTNWYNDGVLRALDRDTLEQVRAYQFSPFGGVGYSQGDVFRVAAGKDGRIIVEEENQWVDIDIVDTATGEQLARAFVREGGGLFDPTGRYYYHGENNSSGAAIKKFDTEGDTFNLLESIRVTGGGYYGSRTVVSSGDGTRVYWNGGVFDEDLTSLFVLNNEVQSATLHGDLIFTNSTIHNGISGSQLGDLPVTTNVQAVASNQEKLFLFSGTEFEVVDLTAIAEIPGRGLTPGIPDEKIVIGTDHELSWSAEPFALSYDVYFGTSRAEVEAGLPGSATHLGQTNGASWEGDLPPFVLDGEYFWRVDVNGFADELKGAVWSFRVAPLDMTPREIMLAYPQAAPVPTQEIEINAEVATAWSAETTTPWITLRQDSGTSDDVFSFDIDLTGLSLGEHDGTIQFMAKSRTFDFPISLEVLAMNIIQLEPDPVRQLVYGINFRDPAEGVSHLLEIDPVTAEVRRSLPIGRNPTDMDSSPDGTRLFVTNWQFEQTQVVDLTSFALLPPLELNSDIYILEASNSELFTEGEDQWVSLNRWDSATGESSGAAIHTVREGDGELDAVNGFYYHCENNITSAGVIKYDVSGPTTSLMESVSRGSTRNLVLSPDGSTIFWSGSALTPDFDLISSFSEEIYATTSGGDLAIGSQNIFWTDSGTVAVSLPAESTVSALTYGDEFLILYDPEEARLQSVRLDTLVDLPGPHPRPGLFVDEAPDQLSWSPVEGASGYTVYLGTDAHQVEDASGENALVYLGSSSSPSLSLGSLLFGRTYYWRVDSEIEGALVSSPLYSFTLRFPAGPPIDLSQNSGMGSSAAIGREYILLGEDNAAEVFSFDQATGESSRLQELSLNEVSSFSSFFGREVALDESRLFVSAAGHSNPVGGRGIVGAWGLGDLNFFGVTDQLQADPDVVTELFGNSLATEGGMLLVGSSGTVDAGGSVRAFVTNPSAVAIQTFQAPVPVANDRFGLAVAIDGNLAAISAPSQNFSLSAAVHLYEFDVLAGQWEHQQTLSIPDAASYANVGRALALDGDWLAVNHTDNGLVHLYRKTETAWSYFTAIEASEIEGASDRYFGASLAIEDDLLFIGDTWSDINGANNGAVFAFRLSGERWVPAAPISLQNGGQWGFGNALDIQDGWLLVTGSYTYSLEAWLFRTREAPNHQPYFISSLPTQAVIGRNLDLALQAYDVDGTEGLEITASVLPSWLSLSDTGNGVARLSGTAPSSSAVDFFVQLRVSDSDGGQSLQAFQISLVDPSEVPVLTEQPIGGSFGVGQEVLLRSAASGTGPFHWQWKRDGVAIQGANSPSLAIPEVALGDAGIYTVEVSNIVETVASSPVVITVRPADRFAGPWPMFGGNSRHSGHYPATLGEAEFVSAWSTQVEQSREINRAVVADGRVYVTPHVYFGGPPEAKSYSISQGTLLWSHAFDEAFSINPPAFHEGKIYIQRGNHSSDSQLWALDAATGQPHWNSGFSAQWERYESPTVTKEGIFVNAGRYGGMYAYELDGTERFFHDLTQVSGWTPTVYDGRLFTWVHGTFTEHNLEDGGHLWSVQPVTPSSSSIHICVVSGNYAVVAGSGMIHAINIQSRSLEWSYDPPQNAIYGVPAVAGGVVYFITSSGISTLNLADGTPGRNYAMREQITSTQPLILNDRLIVSSESNIRVFNLGSNRGVHVLAASGQLCYSDGYLIVAGDDGILTAFYAELPESDQNLAELDSDGDGLCDLVELAIGCDPLLKDTPLHPAVVRDGSSMSYQFTAATGETAYQCQVEVSTDLESWEAVESVSVGTDPETGLKMMRARFENSSEPLFVRLKVQAK